MHVAGELGRPERGEPLTYEARYHARQYIPCVSQESFLTLPEGAFLGRVTAYFRDKLPDAEYDFYLCGQKEMIRDVTFLIDDRFPNALVKTEIFY